MAAQNNLAATQPQAQFFSSSTRNRLSLVPGAANLAAFANRGNLGAGSAISYNSKVQGSQQNGSGPAIAPRTAPFSFTEFATGLRTLGFKRLNGKKK